MNSLCCLPLLLLLLLLLLSHCVVYSSEDGPEDDDYYTAYFPNGQNYTYNTAKSSNRSHWNRTRAAQEILDAHNEARRELNLTTLVSTKGRRSTASKPTVHCFEPIVNDISFNIKKK